MEKIHQNSICHDNTSVKQDEKEASMLRQSRTITYSRGVEERGRELERSERHGLD